MKLLRIFVFQGGNGILVARASTRRIPTEKRIFVPCDTSKPLTDPYWTAARLRELADIAYETPGKHKEARVICFYDGDHWASTPDIWGESKRRKTLLRFENTV